VWALLPRMVALVRLARFLVVKQSLAATITSSN
jgi:hypothetical protein